jgi:hypothetical protein
MSITAPSSATVVPLQPKTARDFQSWREAWHRQVLADPLIGHRAKSVAGFLIWFLNQHERACFPSYETIAQGVAIDRRDAMRAVAKLVVHGHLLRQSRYRKTNYYLPRVVAPCHQGGGTLPPDGGGKTPTLTYDYRTSDLTYRFAFRRERKFQARKKVERLTQEEWESLERLELWAKVGDGMKG